MSLGTSFPSTAFSLVRRMGDGQDQDAWKTFVDLYAPVLYRICRRQGVKEWDAADVVQNVLARVSRFVGGFEADHERGRFRNWLLTITANEIRRHRRRTPLHQNFDAEPGGPVVQADQTTLQTQWAAELETRVYELALERIRQELDATSWQAFQAVWINHGEPQEVAARLGRKVAWVYKLKHQVLGRLREEVERLASDTILSSVTNGG